MHVLLFDIDGTLINTRGSGLLALQLAFQQVFDRPAPDDIPTAGRTDRGIACDLFAAYQIEDTEANWTSFISAYADHLVQQLPQRDGILLPGVEDLLAQLKERPNVRSGLLTGNTPEGAQIKLDYFNIGHHFQFGGYGHENPLRSGVAEAAMRAVREHVSRDHSPERVWVIGDTPMDVQCARHVGARSVAVATGFHPKSDLAAESPDLLLDDLRQAAAWLDEL